MSPVTENFTASFVQEMETANQTHIAWSIEANLLLEIKIVKRILSFMKRSITCISDSGQITHNTLKFTSRHFYYSFVVRVWDSEMLAVDIHQLDIEIRDAVLRCKEQVK